MRHHSANYSLTCFVTEQQPQETFQVFPTLIYLFIYLCIFRVTLFTYLGPSNLRFEALSHYDRKMKNRAREMKVSNPSEERLEIFMLWSVQQHLNSLCLHEG